MPPGFGLAAQGGCTERRVVYAEGRFGTSCGAGNEGMPCCPTSNDSMLVIHLVMSNSPTSR